MSKPTTAQWAAIAVALGAVIFGIQTTEQAVEMLFAAVIAIGVSVVWWIAPPTDNTWAELMRQVTLAVPVALLAVSSGLVTLQSDGAIDLDGVKGLALLLLVPAGTLEAWLLKDKVAMQKYRVLKH